MKGRLVGHVMGMQAMVVKLGWLMVLSWLATASFNAPAKADWQGTKWKMSQEDVRAAFKIPLRTPTAEEVAATSNKQWGSATWVFDYKFRSFQFQGSLYFVDSRLEAIALRSADPGACESAMDTLNTNYGPADPIPYKPTWRDSQNSNAIAVFNIRSIGRCSIQYTPLDHSDDRL